MAASEPGTPTAEAETEAAPQRIEVEGVDDTAAGPALVFPEPEPRPPRVRLRLKLPRIPVPHIRIRVRFNMAIVRFVVGILALLVFLAGLAALTWFLLVPLFFKVVLHRAPPVIAIHTPVPRPPAPTPSPVPTLMPLPPEAPHVSDGMDPRVIGPFALRLAEVNKLAGRKIVTEAEFHDSDVGQRYYTAIVSSCKELLDLWPLKNGKLQEIQAKFHLDEFDRFVFVERFSEGQWGLSTCDGSM